MNVYFNGFDRKEVTLNSSSSAAEGAIVALMSPTTVGGAIKDTNFFGVCSAIRKGSASVVIRGHATVPYSGTAPSLGYNKLTADGEGGVQVSDNGREILVVEIDKANLTCDIIL